MKYLRDNPTSLDSIFSSLKFIFLLFRAFWVFKWVEIGSKHLKYNSKYFWLFKKSLSSIFIFFLIRSFIERYRHHPLWILSGFEYFLMPCMLEDQKSCLLCLGLLMNVYIRISFRSLRNNCLFIWLWSNCSLLDPYIMYMFPKWTTG